ncbi:hypothetical protein N7462_011272 [Penicillium macrosclerotiorum]|uniref:uncharacterized protein n=1 Tax=Penicillium macrosclerotiorum TaxID=303699 RepID=UPI0025492033|nr:uncharacterized protein N7462_011272 [Penicillium macrosclerotiorum]KAJ5666863.1 hypothetical protein N7462_011272 [Penicillium macrosclerotiorum]
MALHRLQMAGDLGHRPHRQLQADSALQYAVLESARELQNLGKKPLQSLPLKSKELTAIDQVPSGAHPPRKAN